MTAKSLLKKLKIDEKAKSQIDDAIKKVEIISNIIVNKINIFFIF